MQKEIIYNEIVIPPCLLVNTAGIKYQFTGHNMVLLSEKYWPDAKQEKQDGCHHFHGTPPGKNSPVTTREQDLIKPLSVLESESKRIIAESIECYLEQMIEQCALRIHMPIQPSIPNPKIIKQSLTPTVEKTVSFLDNSRNLWNAIVKYLEPIRDSVKLDDKIHPYEPSSVYLLGWNIYMLMLGIRIQSQVVMSPESTLEVINMLLTKSRKLSREAQARLKMLKGIFKSFEVCQDIGAFQLHPNASMKLIIERLEEITEDAYLLEASQARRFLSIDANKAALKRDLRKLIIFISKNCSWAKGILSLAEHVGFIGSASVLSELTDALSCGAKSNFQPVCISPISHLKSLFNNIESKRLMVLRNEEGESCSVNFWDKKMLENLPRDQTDFFHVPPLPFM